MNMTRKNKIYESFEGKCDIEDNGVICESVDLHGHNFTRPSGNDYFFNKISYDTDENLFCLKMTQGIENPKRITLNFSDKLHKLSLEEYLSTELNKSERIKEMVRTELHNHYTRSNNLIETRNNLQKGLDLFPDIIKPIVVGGIRILTFPIKLLDWKKIQFYDEQLIKGYACLVSSFQDAREYTEKIGEKLPDDNRSLLGYKDNLQDIIRMYERIIDEKKKQGDNENRIKKEIGF